MDLFWSGDKIVWMNLFKHYLLCLDRACILFMLIGNKTVIDPASIPILETENDLPTNDYKDVYKKICEIFFNTPSVPEYAEGLSSRNRPIRRDELSYHLRILHYHALNTIFTVYKDRGVMTDTPDSDAFRSLCEKIPLRPEILKMTNDLEATSANIPDGLDRLFAVLNGTQLQQVLIAKYNNPASTVSQNSNLIFLDFPALYVRLVEKMVHADWYMACFSNHYANSSMWGHYANNHKGVCLKFKTGVTAETPSLALNGIIGMRASTTEQGGIPIYGERNHEFHRIAYKKAYPEIDFFRSLGRLRGVALSWWYSDGQGNKSSCARDVYEKETEWREKYWEECLEGQTTKLGDWAYEEEYRLVLMGMMMDYSTPQSRKLKYKFADLEGVIFGIDMSEEDKLAIIRVVHEKCKKEDRKDFEFYQAYYAKSTGKIDVSQMNLIKMTESTSKMRPKIAILGWGSLLWDESQSEFAERHDEWRLDGPVLRLEFSRKSASRLNALTLVIDPLHGQECQVAYTMSKRASPEGAIADLRSREKTKEENIGCIIADGSRRQGRHSKSIDVISQWAKEKGFDVVLWTDLPGSFDDVTKDGFAKAALNHVQRLSPQGKAMAAEYVWRAPDFIVTQLRTILQAEPWFQKP